MGRGEGAVVVSTVPVVVVKLNMSLGRKAFGAVRAVRFTGRRGGMTTWRAVRWDGM